MTGEMLLPESVKQEKRVRDVEWLAEELHVPGREGIHSASSGPAWARPSVIVFRGLRLRSRHVCGHIHKPGPCVSSLRTDLSGFKIGTLRLISFLVAAMRSWKIIAANSFPYS